MEASNFMDVRIVYGYREAAMYNEISLDLIPSTLYILHDIVAPEEITYEPIGRGPFGDIYDQFRGKAQEAISFLSKIQDGEAIGALHHKDIGDISLVWGNSKAGLKKILLKHPEVIAGLQGIIDGMTVFLESDNRVKLDSATHFAVISKEILGKPRDKWLLTAYEKKSSATSNSMDTADTLNGQAE